MKKVLKLISIIVVVCMLVTVLGACGSKTSTSSDSTGATEATATKAPDPVELQVTAATGGAPVFGTDDPAFSENPIAKKILADLNIKLKWEVYAGDGPQALSVALAAGTYGGIVFGANTASITKMLQNKMLVSLAPLMDKVGPNVKKALGTQTLNFLKQDDGNIYWFPQNYGNLAKDAKVPGSGWSFQVRNDAYVAAGSPKITTTDDIYNLLKKFKADANFQKTPKGESMFPISGFNRTWGNMIQGLESAGGSETSKWIVKDGKLVYWFNAAGAENIIKFYNKIYTEGLLDKEAFQQDYNTWQTTKVNSGRALSNIGTWNQTSPALAAFKSAGTTWAKPDDMWFQNLQFGIPGMGAPKLNGVSTVGQGQTVITDKCKNPEAAMKLFDYFSIPANNFMVLNGVEGVLWDMKDGKPVLKPEVLKQFTDGAKDDVFSKSSGFGLYGKFISTNVGMSLYNTYWILKDDPNVTNSTQAKQRDVALAPWFDNAPFQSIEAGMPEDVNAVFTLIDKKLNEEVAKVVMQDSEAKAMTAWTAFVKSLNDAGAAKAEAYVSGTYQKNLNKLAGK